MAGEAEGGNAVVELGGIRNDVVGEWIGVSSEKFTRRKGDKGFGTIRIKNTRSSVPLCLSYSGKKLHVPEFETKRAHNMLGIKFYRLLVNAFIFLKIVTGYLDQFANTLINYGP